MFLWCSGYHMSLTHSRSPVRSRAETVFSTFFFSSQTPHVSCVISFALPTCPLCFIMNAIELWDCTTCNVSVCAILVCLCACACVHVCV